MEQKRPAPDIDPALVSVPSGWYSDGMSNPVNTRHKILETAVAIVDTNGAAHLTIDAVAAHAGLSKGGVLYHFPSKRALLEAMLALLMDTSTNPSMLLLTRTA